MTATDPVNWLGTDMPSAPLVEPDPVDPEDFDDPDDPDEAAVGEEFPAEVLCAALDDEEVGFAATEVLIPSEAMMADWALGGAVLFLALV